MEPCENVCLLNCPMELTKLQIKNKFFKDLDLDPNSKINFPKAHMKHEWGTKLAFINFATINEARMAITIINNAEFRGIEAKFGKPDPRARKGSIGKVNGVTLSTHPACVFCGALEPKLMCGGCSNAVGGTLYCGEDHQAKDWLRHKSECKVMPPLIDAIEQITPLSNQIEARLNIADSDKDNDSEGSTKSKFFIKSIDRLPVVGDKVFITCVSSPRVLYVRPVNEDENYLKLLEDVKTTTSIMSKKTEKPEINDHMLAPFQGAFHRAKVIDLFEIDSDGLNAKVFMVDFGDEIKVKWQDCKELNYRLRGLRTYIFKFVLDSVQTSNENHEIIEYIKDIQGNNEALEIKDISKNGERKTLIRSNGEIVNDKIIELAQRAAALRGQTSTNFMPKVLYSNLKFATIPTGHDVKLYVVDNSRLESDKMIACMLHEKFADYLQLTSHIKSFSNGCVPESVNPSEPNELALVKYKEMWRRAVILKFDQYPNELGLALIDLMIDIKADAKDMRKIPETFAQKGFTQLCFVDGLTDENMATYKSRFDCGPIIASTVIINAEDNFCVLKFDFIK